MPGVIGLLEAVETVKLILGVGNPLIGRLLQYDALRAEFVELKIRRDPQCPYCGEWIIPVPMEHGLKRIVWVVAAVLLVIALIWLTVR